MPIDWLRYPAHWREFSAEIRFNRAQSRCECTGQCGMHRPNPNLRRCVELHHKPARWFRGKVTLTVAHLCHCDPPCAIPEHVIAACQRCHLRIDRYKHAQARLLTQHALHWTPAGSRWHPTDGYAQETPPPPGPPPGLVQPRRVPLLGFIRKFS